METARRDNYIESLKWRLLTSRYEREVELGKPFKEAAKDAVEYANALIEELQKAEEGEG